MFDSLSIIAVLLCSETLLTVSLKTWKLCHQVARLKDNFKTFNSMSQR